MTLALIDLEELPTVNSATGQRIFARHPTVFVHAPNNQCVPLSKVKAALASLIGAKTRANYN